jgi:hypothetical protein
VLLFVAAGLHSPRSVIANWLDAAGIVPVAFQCAYSIEATSEFSRDRRSATASIDARAAGAVERS